MKAIEHERRIREIGLHGINVGRRHICGNGLDVRPTGTQAFPEGNQRISAFSVADKDDGTAFQVQDEGDIAMSFADGNLINGDLSQVLQLRFAERPM